VLQVEARTPERLFAETLRPVLGRGAPMRDTCSGKRSSRTDISVPLMPSCSATRRQLAAALHRAALDGLHDEPRVGAPGSNSDEKVERVLVQTLETTPKGRTHWSPRKMVAKTGTSHARVGQIWRTFGLQPHLSQRSRFFGPRRMPDRLPCARGYPTVRLRNMRLKSRTKSRTNATDREADSFWDRWLQSVVLFCSYSTT
jgi:hypothetical protein